MSLLTCACVSKDVHACSRLMCVGGVVCNVPNCLRMTMHGIANAMSSLAELRLRAHVSRRVRLQCTLSHALQQYCFLRTQKSGGGPYCMFKGRREILCGVLFPFLLHARRKRQRIRPNSESQPMPLCAGLSQKCEYQAVRVVAACFVCFCFSVHLVRLDAFFGGCVS